MLRWAKIILLYVAKFAGLFEICNFANRRALRILCYHGFSLAEEHEFRPKLLMDPRVFERRLAWLKRHDYRIAPLDTAVAEFVQQKMPPRTVVITMDDGFYSVYSRAAPMLKNHGFPATVYVTTYYAEHQEPIFGILLAYLFWKSGKTELDLSTGRLVEAQIPYFAARFNETERAALTRELQEKLGIDIAKIARSRAFNLMTKDELAELDESEIDVQLHTHRHRWSTEDTSVNEREISDNRAVLAPIASSPLSHFCYPIGLFAASQWDWLATQGIRSATTLERGLNHFGRSPLGLRRITDGSNVAQIEFEAELCGFMEILRFIAARFHELWTPAARPMPVPTGKQTWPLATEASMRPLVQSVEEPKDDRASGFQPSRYLVRGTAWIVAARWAIRSIGLISTVILARLLTPHDFGLATMAMLIVGFLEIFTDSGQTLALIRHPNPTRQHFDTAWTISVGAGIIVACMVALAAPAANLLFHEPRAVPLVYFLALRPLIAGFENIGIVNFRRDFNYSQEFVYLVMCKFMPFLVLIVAAFVLRTYWAFAIGLVGGRLLSVMFSYWIHPYRPRFSISKLDELWNYSLWMVTVSFADQLTPRIDEVAVGRIFGTQSMGLYNVALDLAYSPTDELLAPVNRNLFAIYARFHKDLRQLAKHYTQILSGVATVSFATAIGVSVVAKDMVAVVLGDKWASAAPLIACLAIGQACDTLLSSMLVVFNVTGNVKRSALLTWIRLLLMTPVAFALGMNWDTQAIAWGRVAVILVMLPIFAHSLSKTIPISYSSIGGQLWRPAVASLIMAVVVLWVRANIDFIPPIELTLCIMVGATSYSLGLAAIWWASGRPDGFERVVLTRLRSKARSRLRAASED